MSLNERKNKELIIRGMKENKELIIREIKEEFSELFEKNTERDIRSGTTNGGIHKDDIEITLNGKSARAFASGTGFVAGHRWFWR